MNDYQWEQETPKQVVPTLLIAAYMVGAFLTFGHVFNANYEPPTQAAPCGWKPDVIANPDGNRKWWDCRMEEVNSQRVDALDAGVLGTISAVAWPAYWAGRGAILVTAPAPELSELADEINKALAEEGMTGVTVRAK